MKWSFSQPIPSGCGEQLISVLCNNLLLLGRLLSWCPLAASFLKPSQLCFFPTFPHWPGFQKHLSVLKSWYKRQKVIAADPGIAGRCLGANVGQMSSGMRQQTLGTECTKVQTCYFGDCSEWGQASGAKLRSANNGAAEGTRRF